MDDRGEKTIFVGYVSGGCKLFNPETKKVIESRNVFFAENEVWKWIENKSNEYVQHPTSIFEEEEEALDVPINEEMP